MLLPEVVTTIFAVHFLLNPTGGGINHGHLSNFIVTNLNENESCQKRTRSLAWAIRNYQKINTIGVANYVLRRNFEISNFDSLFF